ncbi:hypothetical protein CIHG_03282 [Coccidioides immitis H538.4]|uniref:Secreted protein n=1 Tax=Coccidioides immitis H538.4 TaxID=396776 RepID=A0A0J8RND2_COCIT|nr:hypothetical protein CIHG_03282 [Coccidioides immitis H538.4]
MRACGRSLCLSLSFFFFFFPSKASIRVSGLRWWRKRKKRTAPPFQSTFNPVCDKEITAQQPNQQATPHVSLVIPPCSSPFRSEQSTLLEDANKKKHNPFLLHGDPPLRLPLSSVVN